MKSLRSIFAGLLMFLTVQSSMADFISLNEGTADPKQEILKWDRIIEQSLLSRTGVRNCRMMIDISAGRWSRYMLIKDNLLDKIPTAELKLLGLHANSDYVRSDKFTVAFTADAGNRFAHYLLLNGMCD